MILGVVQVRMGSTRLPKKALLEVCGKPLLGHLCERLTFSKYIDRIVIATGDGEENLPIVEFAEKSGIGCYAGSENDLIDRMYNCAKKFGGDVVVRLTGDCPLADYKVIDKVIEHYLANKDGYDFASNTLKPTYPDGLDVDITPFRTIEGMWNDVKDPFWREWFTSYIMERPQTYRLTNVTNTEDLSALRWTVDYPEDFEFAKKVFEELYDRKKDFTMKDILGLLREKPEISDINRKYARNEAYYEAKKEAEK